MKRIVFFLVTAVAAVVAGSIAHDLSTSPARWHRLDADASAAAV
ncbi:hypothetical protein [Nanchangia anserum]|nr:hypothetical protein [Nanchangia anserum]